MVAPTDNPLPFIAPYKIHHLHQKKEPPERFLFSYFFFLKIKLLNKMTFMAIKNATKMP